MLEDSIKGFFDELIDSTIGEAVRFFQRVIEWVMSNRVEVDDWIILIVCSIMLLLNIVLFVSRRKGVWGALPLHRQMTLVHEGGHMLAAFSVLSKVKGISVNKDGSGHTVSLSRGGIIRKLWTSFWGYPAPVITGAFILWMIHFGWIAVANFFVVASIAIYLLLSRSVYAVTTTVVLGFFTVALPMTISHFGFSDIWKTTAVILAAYSWILISSGLVKFWQMFGIHIRNNPEEVQSSDAYSMSRDVGVPGIVWMTLMFLSAVGIGLVPLYFLTG